MSTERNNWGQLSVTPATIVSFLLSIILGISYFKNGKIGLGKWEIATALSDVYKNTDYSAFLKLVVSW